MAKEENTNDKTIEDVKNDPENQQMARTLARQIEGKTSGNWFTLEKIAKKMNETQQQMAYGLFTLIQFGLCVEKYNGKRDQHEYKIDINHDTEIKLIDDEIEGLHGRIESLKQRREKLVNEKNKDLN